MFVALTRLGLLQNDPTLDAVAKHDLAAPGLAFHACAGTSQLHSLPVHLPCVKSMTARCVARRVSLSRSRGHLLRAAWRLLQGVPAREIMAELFGKKTGICRGQGGSMHMFSKKHGLVRACPLPET